MREIGPHKYKSYITPPNYDDGEHWLSATEYSEKVKVMLENEPKKEQYIGMLGWFQSRIRVHLEKVTRPWETLLLLRGIGE